MFVHGKPRNLNGYLVGASAASSHQCRPSATSSHWDGAGECNGVPKPGLPNEITSRNHSPGFQMAESRRQTLDGYRGPEILYTAVVLDSASHTLLLSWFADRIASNWVLIADHMTICLGPLVQPFKPSVFKKQQVELCVTHFGMNSQAAAVRVSGCPSVNALPHITISVAPGVRPVASNDIVTWQPVTLPLCLKGTVVEVNVATRRSEGFVRPMAHNTSFHDPSVAGPQTQQEATSSQDAVPSADPFAWRQQRIRYSEAQLRKLRPNGGTGSASLLHHCSDICRGKCQQRFTTPQSNPVSARKWKTAEAGAGAGHPLTLEECDTAIVFAIQAKGPKSAASSKTEAAKHKKEAAQPSTCLNGGPPKPAAGPPISPDRSREPGSVPDAIPAPASVSDSPAVGSTTAETHGENPPMIPTTSSLLTQSPTSSSVSPSLPGLGPTEPLSASTLVTPSSLLSSTSLQLPSPVSSLSLPPATFAVEPSDSSEFVATRMSETLSSLVQQTTVGTDDLCDAPSGEEAVRPKASYTEEALRALRHKGLYPPSSIFAADEVFQSPTTDAAAQSGSAPSTPSVDPAVQSATASCLSSDGAAPTSEPTGEGPGPFSWSGPNTGPVLPAQLFF